MSASELWQVKVSSGDVMTVTLEQLDSAFADGHVSESTLVREVGTVEWSTLGVVAGLVEAPPPVAFAPAAPPRPAAPRVDPFVVPTPLAPMLPTAPHSYAPMAMDADLDDLAFAPKRKPMAVVLGVCGVCAFVILAALGIGSVSGPIAAAGAAKTESHLASAATPIAPTTPAAPIAPIAHEAAPAAAAPTQADTHLTEAQKKAALAADKKLKGKASKKAAPARKPAKDPFVKGGNKHDPLNKSL